MWSLDFLCTETFYTVKSVIYLHFFVVFFVLLSIIRVTNGNNSHKEVYTMYREALENLHEWKISKYRKPLIIEGDRQVEKT